MKTSDMESPSASLPVTRSLTLAYLTSLVIAFLMTVASVAGLLYRAVIYPTDELLLSFLPNDVLNLVVGLPILLGLFRQFFAALPKELEDAAEVDGCSLFRLFCQIFLPNAKPALATSFIFNFVWVWSDWFTPLIYLSDEKATLAVKLATGYTDPHGHTLITITLAACVVYTLPLVITFFVGQKYILQGTVTSGLKG